MLLSLSWHKNMDRSYDIFDMLALFSVVSGLYNLDISIRQDTEQDYESMQLKRIERKLDLILDKMEK